MIDSSSIVLHMWLCDQWYWAGTYDPGETDQEVKKVGVT
jgi:hypothetical protein